MESSVFSFYVVCFLRRAAMSSMNLFGKSSTSVPAKHPELQFWAILLKTPQIKTVLHFWFAQGSLGRAPPTLKPSELPQLSWSYRSKTKKKSPKVAQDPSPLCAPGCFGILASPKASRRIAAMAQAGQLASRCPGMATEKRQRWPCTTLPCGDGARSCPSPLR